MAVNHGRNLANFRTLIFLYSFLDALFWRRTIGAEMRWLWKLNGFNSRCVSVITGQTATGEASRKTRTIDIVGIFRYRRRQYSGHILRSNPASLLRQDVLQYAELVREGTIDGDGGILMDARGYDSVSELLSQAGCYDWGDAEEDRRTAHARWTLASQNLMSEEDQERMRRGPVSQHRHSGASQPESQHCSGDGGEATGDSPRHPRLH
jgi:hypothetical protein